MVTSILSGEVNLPRGTSIPKNLILTRGAKGVRRGGKRRARKREVLAQGEDEAVVDGASSSSTVAGTSNDGGASALEFPLS